MAVITWNPADKSTSISLSNENLTASTGLSTGTHGLRANGSIASGKKYFESSSGLISALQGIGIANASWPLNNTALGADANSISYRPSGAVVGNNSTLATIAAYIVNSIISIAFDLTNNKIWFRVNGGNWNNDVIANQNPATNTGGVDISFATGPFLAAWYANAAANDVTGNFGAAFTYAIPASFSALGAGEPITRLSLDGYGAKRIRSFDGKKSSAASTTVVPWPFFNMKMVG
jgi:hypothetical protein